MNSLLERIKKETPPNFDFEWLGRFVRGIEIDELDLAGVIPSIVGLTGNYARNILMLEPFEVVVLHWPPGVESAIHHHKGFWGHVLCVDGEVENVEYEFDPERKELREGCALRVTAGGILPEPDGTIHKIVNPSQDEPLVTVHFYAPALDTLDGMVIFDAERGWLGELNERATTASFNQDEDGFRRLEKGAFTFVPIVQAEGHGTHRLYPLIPKPPSASILEGVSAYYAEQADTYDHLDAGNGKRSDYTDGVNRIIAGDLATHAVDRVLHIACGTGRRAEEIRRLSGLAYTMDGVDLSASMVEQARSRGVHARIGHWNDMAMEQEAYDAVTFLYAFGHIPTVAERKRSLLKVNDVLRPGGRFYFDVFNVDDPNEWGPEAIRLFDEMDLATAGYERGDLFYKRHGGDTVAFLHYCRAEGISSLVEECGFRVVELRRIGYVQHAGQELSDDTQGGNLLLMVEKR